MIDVQTYVYFLITVSFIVMTPGPDTLLVISRSISFGKRGGFITLLGTQTGNILHALLAGIGISSLLLFYPRVLEILQWLGACYLLYLAYKTWKHSKNVMTEVNDTLQDRSGLYYFGQGLLQNLTNPKAIPFFVALFPQFINTHEGNALLQSLILGGSIALLALLWIGSLILFVSKIRFMIHSRPDILIWINRSAAATFFALALKLLFSSDR